MRYPKDTGKVQKRYITTAQEEDFMHAGSAKNLKVWDVLLVSALNHKILLS